MIKRPAKTGLANRTLRTSGRARSMVAAAIVVTATISVGTLAVSLHGAAPSPIRPIVPSTPTPTPVPTPTSTPTPPPGETPTPASTNASTAIGPPTAPPSSDGAASAAPDGSSPPNAIVPTAAADAPLVQMHVEPRGFVPASSNMDLSVDGCTVGAGTVKCQIEFRPVGTVFPNIIFPSDEQIFAESDNGKLHYPTDPNERRARTSALKIDGHLHVLDFLRSLVQLPP